MAYQRLFLKSFILTLDLITETIYYDRKVKACVFMHAITDRRGSSIYVSAPNYAYYLPWAVAYEYPRY